MLVSDNMQRTLFLLVQILCCIHTTGGRRLQQTIIGVVGNEQVGVSASSQSGTQSYVLVPADPQTSMFTADIGSEQVAKGLCATLENSGLPEFTLSQSDFVQGTKIIDTPGIYKLTEDIVFNPNSAAALGTDYYSAGDVQPAQFSTYNPKAFGIGFFAAIAIPGKDIVLDLNGHTIVQGKEHALHQRFYFHVELGSTPFIFGQGPHDFGSQKAASNVCIKNGGFGLSAHGAIHGNDNKNVEIRDLTIDKFEVHAIHLNKGMDIKIENIEIPGSRTDVPVVGRFSAARFMRPWVNQVVNGGYSGTLNVNGMQLTPQEIQSQLKEAINEATSEVLASGSVTGKYADLFGNPSKIPDGSAIYGIALNSKGIAVNGMPQNVAISDRSQRIDIRNVNIGTLTVKTTEIPALSVDGIKPAADAVGAVLETTSDTLTLSSTGSYLGNPVANAQLIVAKAIHEGFDFGQLSTAQNKITPEIVAWAESGESYQSQGLKYICNSDIMFHVNKGAIAYKLDASIDVTCNNCVVNKVENQGDIGSTLCNNNIMYYKETGVSNPLATQTGYNGGASRGFSLSSTTNATLIDCAARNVFARAGDAIGFDITHGSSVVRLINVFTGTVLGGTGYAVSDYENNPTPLPRSIAINYDDTVRGLEFK